MHKAEALTNSAGIPSSDTSFYIFEQYEKEIFKKQQVDTADYYKSYKFYLVNPEEFTDLYKLVVDKITDEKMKSTVRRIVPVAKAALSVYGSQKLHDKNAKTANLGFGIVSGLEAIVVNIPEAAKKMAFMVGSTSDIFSQIGSGETVYLPIAPGGNVDNNNDFFTEDAVLGSKEMETIAVL
jgi:hypothetical protein